MRVWRLSAALALALSCLSAAIAAGQSGTTATGTSNKLNPAISLNALFLGAVTDPANSLDGFSAQELELALASIVDAHFRAFANVSFEPSPLGDEASVALEEGFVNILALPTGWGLKAGRFYLPMGRHNQLHSHQFPFISAPRAVTQTLGEANIGDVGILASYLPNLPWYLDIQAYGSDGAADVFDGESRRMAAGGRVASLFELGDATTLETAASLLHGPTEGDADITFAGADVRVQWRDTRQTYGRALDWVTEFLLRHSSAADVPGVYSTVLLRFARQWWTGVGYSWNSSESVQDARRSSENEVRMQLAWVPSEFSAVRAEVGWTDTATSDRVLVATLQLNFTIGAHPAHKF